MERLIVMEIFATTDAMVTAGGIVLVAVIGGPIMWFLVRFDRRNSEQHDENATKLDDAAEAAKRAKAVAEDTNQMVHQMLVRFDRHLEWHAHAPHGDSNGLPNSGVPVPHRSGDYPDSGWNWPGFGK